MTVLPLGRDDPEWVRKRRVAELHDLYARAGFNPRVFYLLLTQRYETAGSHHLEDDAGLLKGIDS